MTDQSQERQPGDEPGNTSAAADGLAARPASSPPSLADSHSPLPPGVESRPGLARVLGPGMAVAMVVGNVIGSGIFLKPGGIAAASGSFGMILSAWVLGGAVCIVGGLCFSELAAMLPRAGGLYVYLREAWGRPVAFLFGWSEFLFGKPASIGALAVAFTTALAETARFDSRSLGAAGCAIGLILLMGWINIAGVIWGGRVQATVTIIKAGSLVLLAGLPFAAMLAGQHTFDVARYQTTFTPATADWATRFGAVMLAVMWAYNGWHGVTPVAEEVRNPQRNLPLALLGGIAILIVLYLGVNLAMHGVLTMEEMAAAGETVPQQMVRRILAGAGSGATQTGVAIISAVIMCSTFGAINSNMLSGPRVSFAMGRDEVFFHSLGLVHSNYRTPAVAIAVQTIMGTVLVAASAILLRAVPALADRSIFSMLTDYVVFSASLFYVLAVAAVIRLRMTHPEWERPFRVPGYPLVPLAGVAFYGWFLWYVYLGKPFEAQVGLVLVAAGLPVYFLYRRWRQHAAISAPRQDADR
ncbi:MAG: amino acid permease [Planctomycetaceae bacterium]|nr:amino acid permease [Planctomycetaceae bacterium]